MAKNNYGYTEGNKSLTKPENAHIHQTKNIILRIEDWILGDFNTANPFQVVEYFEMGLKSRVMRVNDLKINS